MVAVKGTYARPFRRELATLRLYACIIRVGITIYLTANLILLVAAGYISLCENPSGENTSLVIAYCRHTVKDFGQS